jgi:hypothetical protein
MHVSFFLGRKYYYTLSTVCMGQQLSVHWIYLNYVNCHYSLHVTYKEYNYLDNSLVLAYCEIIFSECNEGRNVVIRP